MNQLPMMLIGPMHAVYATLLGTFGRGGDEDRAERDRGAVSLEQVLWFVAAGVSVAVIATILWNTVRDQANTPVVPPSAPTP